MLLPLSARLAAYGVLAWGLIEFVLVVSATWWTAETFDSVNTIPTFLDWFMLLGTVGAGVTLVRRKDPRRAAWVGGAMLTTGVYLGLTGRSGGAVPLDEQLRPFLDAAFE